MHPTSVHMSEEADSSLRQTYVVKGSMSNSELFLPLEGSIQHLSYHY